MNHPVLVLISGIFGSKLTNLALDLQNTLVEKNNIKVHIIDSAFEDGYSHLNLTKDNLPNIVNNVSDELDKTIKLNLYQVIIVANPLGVQIKNVKFHLTIFMETDIDLALANLVMASDIIKQDLNNFLDHYELFIKLENEKISNQKKNYQFCIANIYCSEKSDFILNMHVYHDRYYEIKNNILLVIMGNIHKNVREY